ncbi:MAG: glycosyltransferase [Acidobacteria bacterium]|nr:glycosyltransferase [Acidobacteriota bacterium]
MSSTHPQVSIVIPVFNEAGSLPELLQRLAAVADELAPTEILLVNDGSSDGSWPLLRAAAAADPRFRVLDLNRNYGQHAAVFAGLEASRGEIVVTLDADLQNPPEEIPRLVAKMREGYDVVGTIRENRQDGAFRRFASKMVNRLTRAITGCVLSDYGCMLRAYRRPIVEAMCNSREISSFIPVLAEMYAGPVAEITVGHAARQQGESKYRFWHLVRLFLDLTTSFTLAPLRVAMVGGFLLSGLSFLAALVLIGGRLVMGTHWAVSGVFTLFSLVFVLLGALLFALGLLGEYVGRIYLQVRGRPRFIVRESIGPEGKEP